MTAVSLKNSTHSIANLEILNQLRDRRLINSQKGIKRCMVVSNRIELKCHLLAVWIYVVII